MKDTQAWEWYLILFLIHCRLESPLSYIYPSHIINYVNRPQSNPRLQLPGALPASPILLAPSALLLQLLPTLFHLSSSRLPATIVISLPFADAAKVAAVRGSGCAVLFARSAQEAHDTVLAAHLTSLATRVPAVVIVPSESLHTESDVVLADSTRFSALVEANTSQAEAEPAAGSSVLRRRTEPASLAAFPAKLGEISADLESKGLVVAVPKPASYTGAKDPETVLVAVGSAASALESLIAGASQSVGVLALDILRPWPEAELVGLISGYKKLKTVAVAETEGDALYADVWLVVARS